MIRPDGSHDPAGIRAIPPVAFVDHQPLVGRAAWRGGAGVRFLEQRQRLGQGGLMKIRVGYEMIYDFPQPTPLIAVLGMHFTRASDFIVHDYLKTIPSVHFMSYGV